MLSVNGTDHANCRLDVADSMADILSEMGSIIFPCGQPPNENRRVSLLIGRCRRLIETSARVSERGDGRPAMQKARAELQAEQRHRAGNLASIVQSIAVQTFECTNCFEHFEQRFCRRLEVLTRAETLIHSENPLALRTLIEGEVRAAVNGRPNAAMRIDGPEVALRREDIAMFALAVHELAEFTFRDRNGDGRRAQVFVYWTLQNTPSGQRLTICWLAFGLEANGTQRMSRFARDLIEWGLPYALNAKVRLEVGKTRLSCDIEMPSL